MGARGAIEFGVAGCADEDGDVAGLLARVGLPEYLLGFRAATCGGGIGFDQELCVV